MMTDFLIVVLRGLLEVRTDLKLVLMSASLDAQVFSRYFDRSPVIDIPGRTFLVKEIYLEDVVQMINFSSPSVSTLETEDTNLNLVAKLVYHLHTQKSVGSGAILVFLTGWDEQDQLYELLVNKELFYLYVICFFRI